jgi:hypothetical protein
MPVTTGRATAAAASRRKPPQAAATHTLFAVAADPSAMQVDHVAFGWNDLDPVREALGAVGLPFDAGGTHADGTTHMALTGFADGSYLEYLAPTPGTPATDAGFWPDALAASAGPAAWAVRGGDVAREAKRAIDAGFAVEGPLHGGRDRPDGRRVEWDQVFERVDAADRWLLPFPIVDRTPREWRVAPTDGVTALSGIETVVLGVESVESAAALFDRRYRTPAPVPVASDGDATAARVGIEGASTDDVAVVPGSPLAFARASESRLDRVGERPVAVLLGADDFAAARAAYELTDPVGWGGRRLAWLDHDVLRGRVGVVG